MKISELSTPAAIIDTVKMERNIRRMQIRMDTLGVSFRPHVKTSKCLPVVRAQIKAGARGITVSTLKEADYFFEQGITDILYAVGIGAGKLEHALKLRRMGCDLKIITDSPDAAAMICAHGKTNNEKYKVYIEIDTDGHRSGLKPEREELIQTAVLLANAGVQLEGVLTHAGSSYELNTPEALKAMAEQERAGSVRAAERIRAAGITCPNVTVGSTPTALSAERLDGITEVRAGVYVFFDLVMHNTGVCGMNELALSVLTTVIGHQPEKGWAIVDAGWMAMSRDRGTASQHQRSPRTQKDYGYGQVCDAGGRSLPYIMTGANQEHGIISSIEAIDPDIVHRFPLGTILRILPNHACATGAQFPEYNAADAGGNISVWPRIYGW